MITSSYSVTLGTGVIQRLLGSCQTSELYAHFPQALDHYGKRILLPVGLEEAELQKAQNNPSFSKVDTH